MWLLGNSLLVLHINTHSIVRGEIIVWSLGNSRTMSKQEPEEEVFCIYYKHG